MPIDFTRVKAICFDVDGTLSNTDDQFVQKIVRLLSPVQFMFHQQDAYPFARRMIMFTEGPGNWIYHLADWMGWDDKIVAFSDWLYEMRIGETEKPFILVDGVHELLVKMRDHFPLSIISARGRKSTFRFLFQFELLQFFTAVATGQTCTHTKPYPEPIYWAAQMMGVPSSSCLMVGDTVSDILAGKRAGSQTVGVLCGFGTEKELRKAGADIVIKNTPDLLDIFQSVK